MSPNQSLPRRGFLTGVASAGAAAALGLTPTGVLADELAWKSTGIQLDRVTVKDFANRLGTTFQIEHLPGMYLRAELVKAALTPRRPSPRAARREPFSLTFHVPQKEALPQNTYQVWHPKLGQFSLFLVPIGRPPTGTRVEAIFS